MLVADRAGAFRISFKPSPIGSSGRCPAHRHAVVSVTDVAVTVTNAASVTAAQWRVMDLIKGIVPDAEIVVRSHVIGWKKDPNVPPLVAFGVRVTRKIGPF